MQHRSKDIWGKAGFLAACLDPSLVGIFTWLLSLMMPDLWHQNSVFSVFSYRLKISSSPGMFQVRLGLLRNLVGCWILSLSCMQTNTVGLASTYWVINILNPLCNICVSYWFCSSRELRRTAFITSTHQHTGERTVTTPTTCSFRRDMLPHSDKKSGIFISIWPLTGMKSHLVSVFCYDI